MITISELDVLDVIDPAAPVGRALPFPTVELRAQPTQPAVDRAAQLNRIRLKRNLRFRGQDNAGKFLETNFDALHTYYRDLPHAMDMLNAKIADADPKISKQAKKNTYKLALYALRKFKPDVSVLETSIPAKSWATPLGEQFEMDRKSAYQARAKDNIKIALLEKPAAAFNQVWKATSALGAGMWHTFEAPVHLLGAFADYRGWSKNYRNAVFSSWIGILAVAPAVPLPAAWVAPQIAATGISSAEALPMGAPARSCAVREIFPLGMDAAAFELGLKSNDPIKKQHYISAKRGALIGVSPAAMYAISSFETAGFRDSTATNSSASGAYQTIKSTKLHWLSAYAKDTPTYKEAKARLASTTDPTRDEDLEFITAVDTTIATYRSNPEAMIARVQAGRMNLSEQTALESTNRPTFSGDLMAAYIKDVAPYLTVDALKDKSQAEFVTAISQYYKTHLMGTEGGTFFQRIEKAAPNMRIDNYDGIAAQGYGNSHYYMRVSSVNPAIFKFGSETITPVKHTRRGNVPGKPVKVSIAPTFGAVGEQIRENMRGSARPVLAGMQRGMEQASAMVDNCLELQAKGKELDRQRMVDAAAERVQSAPDETSQYRSMYSVAWERASNAYVASTSPDFRASVSSAAAGVWGTAAEGLDAAHKFIRHRAAPRSPTAPTA